jgi:hypothetical protein
LAFLRYTDLLTEGLTFCSLAFALLIATPRGYTLYKREQLANTGAAAFLVIISTSADTNELGVIKMKTMDNNKYLRTGKA